MLLSEIVIDEDFAALMPPLDEEAFETLRANVVKAGKILDPLIVWKGHGILVDGHNRLRVYNEESAKVMVDIPRIEEVEFADRGAVLEWMYLHQRGRRNWTANQMSVLRAKVYKAAKQRPETQARDPETASFSKNDPQCHNDTAAPDEDESARHRASKTATKVGAEIGGVSPETVFRDVTYDDAIESIKTVNSKAAADLIANRLKLSKKETIALAMSGDIAKGLRNLKLIGDWRGEASEEPDAEPAPPSPAVTLISHGLKAHTTLLTHIEKLKHITDGQTAAFNKINAAMKDVFDGLKKLEKAAKA